MCAVLQSNVFAGLGSYRRIMRIRAFALPICTAAVLLSACTTSPVEPAPAPSVTLARMDRVRGDLDAVVRSGAVGAIATLTEKGATTVVTSGLADIAAGTPIPTDLPQHVRVGASPRLSPPRSCCNWWPNTGSTSTSRSTRICPVCSPVTGWTGTPSQSARSWAIEADCPDRPNPGDERVRGGAGRPHLHPGTGDRSRLTESRAVRPRRRIEYTNTNYIVTGMLIEAVTGHRYTDELRDRILTPLALSGHLSAGHRRNWSARPASDRLRHRRRHRHRRDAMEPSLPWTSARWSAPAPT